MFKRIICTRIECMYKTLHQLSAHQLRHIRLIHKRQALPTAAQHARNGHRRAQLGREARPRPLRPGPAVLILAKLDVRRARVGRLPLAPAGRVDHVRHRRVLDGHAGVRAPRAAEVVRAARHGGRLAGDGGVIDDVVGGVGGGCTAGCYWSKSSG